MPTQMKPATCSRKRFVSASVRDLDFDIPKETSKRAFPWREPFLAALRLNPKMVLACKAANISRNTVYTHLRKDARFRRQWEHAQEQAWNRLRHAAWAAELARPYRQKCMAKMARLGITFPDWFQLS
jgi:hypothetical protein